MMYSLIFSSLFFCFGKSSDTSLEKYNLSPEAAFNVLPTGVQNALSSLDDEFLVSIFDSTVKSGDNVFEEIVMYLTLDWTSTGCEWLNDVAEAFEESIEVIEDGWEYLSSGQVVEDAGNVMEDIVDTWSSSTEETICGWFGCLNDESIPSQLRIELTRLIYIENDLKLARMKFSAWKINGIVWNDEFRTKLGFESDDKMVNIIDNGLKKLYAESKKSSSRLTKAETPRNFMKSDDEFIECVVTDPIEIINPYYVALLDILSSFLEELDDKDTAITIGFGAEASGQLSIATASIGGILGFAMNGHGDAFVFGSTAAAMGVSTPSATFASVSANFLIEFAIYSSIDIIPGSAITGSISAGFGGYSVSAGVVWPCDSDTNVPSSAIPDGVTFVAAYDILSTGFDYSAGVEVGYTYCGEIAVLVNSECSAKAAGLDYDELMMNSNYPKIGGSFNDHQHVKGGSTGNALITVHVLANNDNMINASTAKHITFNEIVFIMFIVMTCLISTTVIILRRNKSRKNVANEKHSTRESMKNNDEYRPLL